MDLPAKNSLANHPSAKRVPTLWEFEPGETACELNRALEALEQENRRLRDLVVRLTETAICNIVRRQAG
jgi:hypothetical protein